MTKKYNYENLINDINNLDLVAHRHSLVIIKNKDKYLLYDDERWQCKLFINYKTKDENNETAIKEALEKDLQLDTSTINCEFVTSRTQEKYSVSHNENRIYNHNLYSITLSKLPAYMKKDNFVINNKHYYWMTMDEMLSDSNIKEKNLEVVYFVKDSISYSNLITSQSFNNDPSSSFKRTTPILSSSRITAIKVGPAPDK